MVYPKYWTLNLRPLMVYLKCWTLNLRPVLVYPKVLCLRTSGIGLWGRVTPPVVGGGPGSQDDPRSFVGDAVHQQLWRRHALRPPVHRLDSENPALKRLQWRHSFIIICYYILLLLILIYTNIVLFITHCYHKRQYNVRSQTSRSHRPEEKSREHGDHC